MPLTSAARQNVVLPAQLMANSALLSFAAWSVQTPALTRRKMRPSSVDTTHAEPWQLTARPLRPAPGSAVGAPHELPLYSTT